MVICDRCHRTDGGVVTVSIKLEMVDGYLMIDEDQPDLCHPCRGVLLTAIRMALAPLPKPPPEPARPG